MDFVAIDFETTGYAGDASNDPWQLGVAVVQGGEIAHNDDFLETEIGGITDNPELLSLKPAVFTKIFKIR